MLLQSHTMGHTACRRSGYFGVGAMLGMALLCASAVAYGARRPVPVTPRYAVPRDITGQPLPMAVVVELSANTVAFQQDGEPGILEAQAPVELRIRAGVPNWAVHIQAGPLVNQQGTHSLGADRLMVRSQATAGQPDTGAGPGFVPLATPLTVATGPLPLTAVPLEFRLKTTWLDAPGEYAGQINILALTQP